MQDVHSYSCAKCHNPDYEVRTVSTTGGWLSRVFDFQSNRFTAIICRNCGYTEFYKGNRSTGANIADILTGG